MFSTWATVCILVIYLGAPGSPAVVTVLGTTNPHLDDLNGSLGDVSSRIVLTADTQHTVWPTPNAIPYRLDSRYSAADVATITTAMAQISSDMSNCIRFVPYVNATDFGTKPHLYIGPLTTPAATPDVGTLFQTCFSFPGLVNNVSVARGAQKLGLVNGTDGCLQSQRETMKYLVNALGIRDEWKRNDRNTYIQVNQQNIKNLGTLSTPNEIIRLYNESTGTAIRPAGQTVNTMGTAFDYTSITMPRRDKYANPGTFLYTITQGVTPNPPLPNPIAVPTSGEPGNLARLSRDDCRALQAIYSTLGCSTITCQDPYTSTPGGAVVPALTPIAVPVVPGGAGAVNTLTVGTAAGAAVGTPVNGTPVQTNAGTASAGTQVQTQAGQPVQPPVNPAQVQTGGTAAGTVVQTGTQPIAPPFNPFK